MTEFTKFDDAVKWYRSIVDPVTQLTPPVSLEDLKAAIGCGDMIAMYVQCRLLKEGILETVESFLHITAPGHAEVTTVSRYTLRKETTRIRHNGQVDTVLSKHVFRVHSRTETNNIRSANSDTSVRDGGLGRQTTDVSCRRG